MLWRIIKMFFSPNRGLPGQAVHLLHLLKHTHYHSHGRVRVTLYRDIIFFYYHLYFKNMSSVCMCEITPTSWMKRKPTYVFSCWFSLSKIIYIIWSNIVVHVMLLLLQWHIFSLSKLIFIFSLWMQLLHLIFLIKKKCLLILIARRRVMNIC